jgi:hypothetical protein
MSRSCDERLCDILQYTRPRFGVCTSTCSVTQGRLDRIPHPASSRGSLCVITLTGDVLPSSRCEALDMVTPADSRSCNTASCFSQVRALRVRAALLACSGAGAVCSPDPLASCRAVTPALSAPGCGYSENVCAPGVSVGPVCRPQQRRR